MNKHITKLFLLCLSMLIFHSPSVYAEQQRYVSDTLTIPMRSGPTIRHKILRFLPSGTPLRIQEVSEEEGYSRIQTGEGDEGWVETSLLMDEPSARDQIVKINEKYDGIKQQNIDLKKTISSLESERKDLQSLKLSLEQKNTELHETLDELKTAAANPIRIAEQNKELEQTLGDLRLKNQQLIDDNAMLADQNIKEWFMIGGGVALGSLFLGLIIPRINWRKRNSWGGGGF